MFSKFFTFSLSAFFALVFMGTASICLAQGTWATKTRHVHRSCAVDGKIYVMGGITSIGCADPTDKVEEYDPQADTWDTTKTPMPTPRDSFGLSVVGGKIYAIGGQRLSCTIQLSTVEVYDPITDIWVGPLTPMLTPRAGLSTSVVNGKIYAIGGYNSSGDLNTVEEYDPVNGSWDTKAVMPHTRVWFSTVVVDDKIYAFPQWWGGPDSIDVYDPEIDSWITIDRTVQLGADCSAASTVDSLIYTFGGLGFMTDVWEYDPASENWRSMSPMPTGRADAPATVVGGMIYVIGGSTTPWPATPSSMVEEYTPPTIPVELTSFTANVNNNGNVILNWSTATELNNQMFEIERRSDEGQYLLIGNVDGHGTTTEPQEYSYTDNTVGIGTYFYRIKQIDFSGQYEYSEEIEIEVEVMGPLTFGLEQNYPNPFNPATTISYSLQLKSQVELIIYNTLGESVMQLVNEEKESGKYSVKFDATNLPSGVYFYRLQANNFTQIRKMIFLK